MLDFLAKSLDAHAMEQKVLANNIANVNTPNFKGTEVTFKDQMENVLRNQQLQLPLKTDDSRDITSGLPLALDDVKPRLITDPTTSMRSDGNNIDIDQQMATLAKNSMETNALMRLVSINLSDLRAAIEGR